MANSGQRWAMEALKTHQNTNGDIYHDDGRHIVYLAKEAGVSVGVVHVDLSTLTSKFYTVTPEGERIYGRS